MHPYLNRRERRMAQRTEGRMAQRTEGRRPARRSHLLPRVVPMIIGSHLLLSPIEQIVDLIERGGQPRTSAEGQPLFQAADGKWQEAAPAIQGLIWHFEMWCIRHHQDLPLQPLRDLHTALHFLVPVQETTLEGLRTTLPALRRVMALGERADQGDLMHQTLIKSALEAQA